MNDQRIQEINTLLSEIKIRIRKCHMCTEISKLSRQKRALEIEKRELINNN